MKCCNRFVGTRHISTFTNTNTAICDQHFGIIAIQFMPNATWAFVLYVPAMICINAPFGIANGSLPVIAPSLIHAQVAAIYLFVVSVGNLLGPPIAGFFNEVVFPDKEGVRYSIISVTLLFGVLGFVLLQLARRPYAAALQHMNKEVAA